MSVHRLDFFDRFPNLGTTITAAALFAPFISPKLHGRPFIMVIAVNRQCNSRCKMCNIWREKDTPRLSLDDYRHIFREPYPSIRTLVLTGGEPTLRADLPDIFAIVRPALPQLEYAMVATSGLNVQRTLDQVRAIAQTIRDNPGRIRQFAVQVSIDGIGAVHDQVRGIPGFFERVLRTLAGLDELQREFSFLRPRLSCVVMPENLHDMPNVKAFARQRNLPIHFSPVVLSGTYYRNLEHADQLGFLPGSDQNAQAQDFFRTLSAEEYGELRFNYEDAADMIGGAERRRTCLMGFFGCLIEHTGDVYPCVNWEQESFGNLLTESFDDIWFGDRARAARYKLRRTGCPTCTPVCYSHVVGATEVIQEKVMSVEQRAKQMLSRLLPQQPSSSTTRPTNQTNHQPPVLTTPLATDTTE